MAKKKLDVFKLVEELIKREVWAIMDSEIKEWVQERIDDFESDIDDRIDEKVCDKVDEVIDELKVTR